VVICEARKKEKRKKKATKPSSERHCRKEIKRTGESLESNSRQIYNHKYGGDVYPDITDLDRIMAEAVVSV